ncbi:MAG: DnaJ domain-containing protein [Flavobacteriales bacterium]|nr:DnaJ domain-containing protein [Flavobacteriales bacterium]
MHKYYSILGLQYGASLSEIKKAYYKLSKQYHPDLNNSPEAILKFREVNEAYEILCKLKSLLSTPYTAKKVTKQWVKDQKNKAAKNAQATRTNSHSKKKVSKEISKRMFRKDIRKMVRAYVVILMFFGSFELISYVSQTKDNVVTIQQVFGSMMFFGSLTTIVFIGIVYHFIQFYKRN